MSKCLTFSSWAPVSLFWPHPNTPYMTITNSQLMRPLHVLPVLLMHLLILYHPSTVKCHSSAFLVVCWSYIATSRYIPISDVQRSGSRHYYSTTHTWVCPYWQKSLQTNCSPSSIPKRLSHWFLILGHSCPLQESMCLQGRVPRNVSKALSIFLGR